MEGLRWIRDIESQLGQISGRKEGSEEEGIMLSGMARWSTQIVAQAIGLGQQGIGVYVVVLRKHGLISIKVGRLTLALLACFALLVSCVVGPDVDG